MAGLRSRGTRSPKPPAPMLLTQRGCAQTAGGSLVALVSPRLRLKDAGTHSTSLVTQPAGTQPTQVPPGLVDKLSLEMSQSWPPTLGTDAPREESASLHVKAGTVSRSSGPEDLSRLNPRVPWCSGQPGLTLATHFHVPFRCWPRVCAAMGPQGEAGLRPGGAGASSSVHP